MSPRKKFVILLGIVTVGVAIFFYYYSLNIHFSTKLNRRRIELTPEWVSNNMTSMEAFLPTFDAVPRFLDNRKMEGFIITKINNDSLFKVLDIRKDDIILKINEITMDNIGRGLDAFRSIRAKKEAAVIIRRDGGQFESFYKVDN